MYIGHKDISITHEYTYLMTQDVQIAIHNLHSRERKLLFFRKFMR
jgi:site-specific recombinase XerD